VNVPTIEQARSWYRDADAVHDFEHVLRVYRLAENLAEKEGADMDIVRAAALLHDARGCSAGDRGEREEHHEASARFAAEVLTDEGWPQERIEAVQHCILTHRFRSPQTPETIEAQVLFDADKLDAIGAIGAVRAVSYAILDGQPPYAQLSETFLKTFEKEPGEPHSAYHEFFFKLSKIKDRLYTRTGKVLAEARHRFLADFFEQLWAEVRGER
jgi:uncharacterized protein